MFNWLAIVVAVVASIVLGSFWYSPMLFGNQWMKLMGIDPSQKDKMKDEAKRGYALMLINSFLTAIVIGYFVNITGASGDIVAGVRLGFFAWVGFMLPLHVGDITWGRKPVGLFQINAAYWFVNMLIMSAIISVWV